MKSGFLLCLLASCLLVAAAPSRAGTFRWEHDLAKAQETAKSEHKPVFLLFTGSTWCGVCMLLEKNVLSTDAFRKFAAERLVAVKIDFKNPPFAHEDEKQVRKPVSDADKAKMELAKKFNVNVGQDSSNGLNGFPSVFILSPEGVQIGQPDTSANAAQQGVGPFLKELEQMVPNAAKP